MGTKRKVREKSPPTGSSSRNSSQRSLTENETPLLSCSIYFYGRITYIVIIAELHMKLVSECTETPGGGRPTAQADRRFLEFLIFYIHDLFTISALLGLLESSFGATKGVAGEFSDFICLLRTGNTYYHDVPTEAQSIETCPAHRRLVSDT